MFKLVVKESFKNFKGTYWVNTDGRVFNSNYHSTGKWAELKYDYTRNGYPSFTISVNGKVERYQIHRIVAQLFVPNPENKPCIDHKNDNRKDPRACNLQWVTLTENNQKQSKRELLKKRITGKHLSDEAKEKISVSAKNRQRELNGRLLPLMVGELLPDGTWKIWDSVSDAAVFYGVHRDTIAKCARGERKTAVEGRKWKYFGYDKNNIAQT